jgi:hypothetical protein
VDEMLKLLREALPYVDSAASRSTGRTPSEIARDMKRVIGHAVVGNWAYGTKRFCEAEMRRLTNGERGCANPAEHRR